MSFSDSTLPLLPRTCKRFGRPDGKTPCIDVYAALCQCGCSFSGLLLNVDDIFLWLRCPSCGAPRAFRELK
jgi:hypothetical protein